MLCYECFQAGTRHDAIGICHHCSVALCPDHAHVISDPVTAVHILMRVDVLPKKARLVLCDTCLSALHQERVAS